jgi:outer membrane receptor protein involved in Fe transport
MSMKNPTASHATRARKALAFGLAAMLTVSYASGQTTDPDALRQLQEENAALRKRLAAIEGSAQPAPTAAPAATTPATSSAPAAPVTTATQAKDPNTLVLSPFVVSSEKDYGYLKTNSATATRIGQEIQHVPLAISVLSEDFIKDTGMRDIQDTLRYVASSSGDPRMGIRPPGNSATPSGNMKLRGFPISQRLRNGVGRYTNYSLDNIDRVEIIKGPASIFYGLGFPGGVINFVTKKPQFAEIPTTMSYGYGGQGDNVGDQRATFDHNDVLSKNTAFRVVGAWDNLKGDKEWEYQKGFSVTPSLTFRPSEKLTVNFEVEHSEMKRNQDDSSWIYNEDYFKDYKAPSASLLTAAGINPTAPDAIAQFQTKLAGNSYGTWVGFKRVELKNPNWAQFQTVSRGAYYNDINGNRVHDPEFNIYGRGSYTQQSADVAELTVDVSPVSFLDARYVFTYEDGQFESLISSAAPWGNGNEFNMASGLGQRGDKRKSKNHQLDLVFKKEGLFKMDHKLLAGGLFNQAEQRFYGYGSPFIYSNIPGAAIYNPSLPANPTTNIPPNFNAFNWGLAYQTLKDRTGQPLNAFQVFQRWDPAAQVDPDIQRITAVDRGIVDQGKPQRKEYYLNYQGDALDKRLHVMGGYRWTFLDPNGGQRASSNPPWYTGGPDMRDNLDPSLYNAYGIGTESGNTTGIPNTGTLGSFYQGSFLEQKGTSWMLGASYDVTKDVSLYASYSNSFRPNSSNGAIYTVDRVVAHAAELGLNGDTELARIRSEGADVTLGNETGNNYEFGAKVSMLDQKLVGTFSVFRLDRQGEALEDVSRELEEPLNWSGPNKSGTFSTNNALGGVRWFSNTSERRVEGAEVEFIWTPIRNNQVVVSGSWLWTAKTLLDSSINPIATDDATETRRYYTYSFRMPGTPEFRFNVFDTYTFTSGPVRGLRVSLGARYSSVMNIQNSAIYNSKTGGLTAGDFWVFDGNIEYPWEIKGYRIKTGLNVTNILDENYSDGGGDLGTGGAYSLSPPRVWMLTNTLSF